MNYLTCRRVVLTFRIQKIVRALCLILGPAGLIAQSVTEANDEEVVELSPFTVESSSDSGYVATSTLAGTRIRTEIKDLASSISVVTSEFMEDTEATDAGSLLSYLGNAETGGLQGNFSGAGDQQDGRYFQPDERTNPQFNQRVRGLGKAALTRGYFLTSIPFDSYNTDRVTINRGPNSLLFGIGDPGGVLNTGLKQAYFGETFGQVRVRVGGEGSFRTSVDINQELIDDRFAVRLAALYDDEKFKQKPAWETEERFYIALNATLAQNKGSEVLGPTTLRANFENGDVEGSPVEVIPPSIAFGNWYEPVDPSISQYTGQTPPGRHVSPADGGTWQFQETYNPFLINSEGGINTNTHPVVFRHMLAVYNNASSSTPGIGQGGLEGMLGLIAWNSGRDTLESAGLSGTPGVAPLEDGAVGPVGLNRYVAYHTNSPLAEGYAIGFAVPTLQDRNIFDYRNQVYSGGIDRVERNFDAINIALEQTFFNNALGIELAYDQQEYTSYRDFFFTGGNGTSTTGPYDIYVDINEFLPNGQPNPNLGRAYTRVARPETRNDTTDRETFRATVFATYDFAEKYDNWLKFLGKHSLTGLYNESTTDTFSNRWFESWNSDTEDIASIVAGATLDHFRRPVNVSVYTSDSLLGTASISDVRLQQIQIDRPQPFDTYNMVYGDAGKTIPAERAVSSGEFYIERYLRSQGIGRREIDSSAFSWQSNLLDDHIVGLWGWREDKTRSFARANETESGIDSQLPDGSWNPEATILSANPSLVQSGETYTWSAVARFPEKYLFELPAGLDLQAHYGESENFNPIGLRTNTLGQTIGQPSGTTKEYGFLVSTEDGRASIKLNWFETNLENISVSGAVNVPGHAASNINAYRAAELDGIPFENQLALVGNPAAHPIKSYADFYAAFDGAIPAILRPVVNPRWEDTDGDGVDDRYRIDGIPNLSATADRSAEGFEIEAVFNPTSAWRLLLNVSQQETVQTNTALVNAAATELYTQNMEAAGLLEMANDPTGAGQLRPIGETWTQNSLAPIRAQRSFDGTKSNEQREWRVNAVTNYQFQDGPFKGVGLGGAVRWQSAAATGYLFEVDPDSGIPVPVVSQPYLDDGIYSGDVWVSYRKKLTEKIEWSIQLNVRNVIGDDDDLPVKTNPDGQVAVIRIPNPTTWYVTNSFRF